MEVDQPEGASGKVRLFDDRWHLRSFRGVTIQLLNEHLVIDCGI